MKMSRILGSNKEEIKEQEGEWIDDDGWRKEPISLKVPFNKSMKQSGTGNFAVGTLHYRSITEVVKEKLRNQQGSQFFHYAPHESLWKPSEQSPKTRVYSELYNSNAFIRAHQEVHNLLNNPQCTLPRVVVGLMFWSDQTHLTSFGGSKAWPLYMCFANESKYRRCKPNSDLCHQIAYFETMPERIKDFIAKRTGGKVQDKHLAFLNREAFHEQWSILLDEELQDAIENGIVLMCHDGVLRRFYIRIFTYSADYPEKILLAGIKRGNCPCPRCLVSKADLHELGMQKDMKTRKTQLRTYDSAVVSAVDASRTAIFERGAAVQGATVDTYLKDKYGFVANQNAFGTKLTSLGFNICSALVVDLLHEFEIGVWKSLFIHLIRLLNAIQRASLLVHELDKRYRLVPVFGQAIRLFSSNTSSMARRAARDYEDVLQCSIAVFQDLFPAADQEIVLKLLYLCCQWHSLAKLRLHTDYTLNLLQATTAALGNQFRLFVNSTCEAYVTYELPKEAEARQRRARMAAENLASQEAADDEEDMTAPPPEERVDERANDTISTTAVAPPPSPGFRIIATNHCQDPVGPHGTCLIPVDTPTPRDTIVFAGVARVATSTHSGVSSTTQAPLYPTITVASAPDTTSPTRRESDPPNLDQPSPLTPRIQGPQKQLPVHKAEANTLAGRRPKKLNISTYKFHALGDYVSSIQEFGPCDSYSTELGELMHRRPKAWYRRTNRRQVSMQLSRIERRRARLLKLRRKVMLKDRNQAYELEVQRQAARDPNPGFFIGMSQGLSLSLKDFADNGVHRDDPACNGFVFKLRSHLHGHLHGAVTEYLSNEYPGYRVPITYPKDWSYVRIEKDLLFAHRIMRIKYKTYDMRIDEDIIHIDTDNCNIMVHNPDFLNHPAQGHHPYIYAKVLKILRVDMDIYALFGHLPSKHGMDKPKPLSIPILWVRWYSYTASGQEYCLPSLEFKPLTSRNSTGFVNPNDVVRACHIIPKFSQGQRYNQTTGGSSALVNDVEEWLSYSVNRFADRDMFMRYECGHAVGHIYPGLDTSTLDSLSTPGRCLLQDGEEVRMEGNLNLEGDVSDSESEIGIAEDDDDMDIDDHSLEMYGIE
ncbi:hypothetical protein FA15DRAFT_638473 [Coprinopsis marcescibilis]|uniref:Uncharacterized protein n=1 Tax=Coprinopsis marcescibilis TaxID=230819 RepID=A0A5C3KZ94_COPMA|nr:hypothetical protein FA15DRAFT_638473 [Coprinopsis marcescibilis]